MEDDAVSKSLKILQFNVQGEFPHAPLSEEVYIHTPKGCKQTSPYLKLKKSLYGHIHACMHVTMGPPPSSSMFMTYNLACHPPNTLLGMKFKIIGKTNCLSQPKYINHGKKLGLMECRPSSTPLMPNLQLSEASDKDHMEFNQLNIKYWSTIVKKNLCHTQDLKFTIYPVKPSKRLSIYSDATSGDNPESCTSQSGYLCYLLGSLIPWNSCQQCSITYSSTEAELNPLAKLFHEGVWLKALINEMWNLQIKSAAHFISNKELHEQLTSDNKTFKERYCTNP
ncbi:hypothetical protein VP01_163g1 [Puccinia sorghi]|uniref:Reverse transcriptase Ty1/copia-type domain-containing protein n=1 Tax=Puccinia sorghi TaxID=27349 RepID=A0A0L6VH97_9BASI|nr:hypothetical protein VP01_163g1 [Puccinia sorghi]